MEIKLTPRATEVDLLKKVERLEVFEERFKMYFEKISINVADSYWFYLLCEVYPKNGATFEDSFRIQVVLYDKDNKIINESSQSIISSQFFGFEVVRIYFFDDGIAKRVEKIRLYPKH